MSTSPHIPKPQPFKGRPSKVTLESLYEHIESLEKMRVEREVKLQTELEAMLDNKFRLLEDNIQTQIENRILGFETQLQRKWRLEYKKWKNKNNQPKKERSKQIST
jgi:hypothetical protein